LSVCRVLFIEPRPQSISNLVLSVQTSKQFPELLLHSDLNLSGITAFLGHFQHKDFVQISQDNHIGEGKDLQYFLIREKGGIFRPPAVLLRKTKRGGLRYAT
jgi:hypothetical protein